MGPTQEKLVAELKKLLLQIGPDNIWRPVYTPDHQLLSPGIGDADDGLAEELFAHAFQNKTVIDLGCNLGYYSFRAYHAGAAAVLGIDFNPLVIRGCTLLKQLFQAERMVFRSQDFTTLNAGQAHDIGIMVDLIGKINIRTGLLPNFLDAIERVSSREMILSVRPIYRINKHLANDLAGIRKTYPEAFIRDGRFYALEYVLERFRPSWKHRIVAPRNDPEGVIKETVHLVRISPRSPGDQ